MWASIGRTPTAHQPACRQHGSLRSLRSAPPPMPHAQMPRHGSHGSGMEPPPAKTHTRRPMAAWVRRFRRDPPLPREQRLPCALDPVVDPAADAALLHERDLSADALLAEAQRVIASLGAQSANMPASSASTASTTRAAAAPLPAGALQRSVLTAPTLPAPPCVPAGRCHLAAAQLHGGLGPGSTPAWDSAAVSSSSSAATGGEHGSEDGSEDDDGDLLERWRCRQRAQKARLLHSVMLRWRHTWHAFAEELHTHVRTAAGTRPSAQGFRCHRDGHDG